MLMRTLLLSLLLLSSAVAADRSQFFTKLDRDWADATVHADLTRLDRILADDLTYTHSSGDTDDKQQFLEALRSGKRKYESIEFHEVTVRSYGNTAVITSRAEVRVRSGDRELQLRPRFLHVYVKRRGSWRLVAHQSTNVAE